MESLKEQRGLVIELAMTRAILDLARWAPSGDNTQPWRFAIESPAHVVVHGFDTRQDCVYDLDGHSSQLAVGAMLETLGIAATGFGLRTLAVRRRETSDVRPVFDVRLSPDQGLAPSKLLPYVRARTVQRRPMQPRRLTAEEKLAIESSVGERYRVRWLETTSERWRAAKLMWRNAKLRLTLPEAYEVHRRIIEWRARFSEDRIPEQALGVDPLSARLMQFAMRSWPRVEFMNRWLGGTIFPRLQLDLIPSLACAAHFAIYSSTPCRDIDDYVAAGAVVQRAWLTATSLGLQLQPEMTPLIFSRYAATGLRFSTVASAQSSAQRIARDMAALFGSDVAERAVFMARIGYGSAATARSLRLPLEKLMQQ